MSQPGRHDNSLVLGTRGPLGLWPYRLSEPERAMHCLILGVIGQGKSKLVEHCLVQDIRQGRSCGLIAADTDLVNDTFRQLASQPEPCPAYRERVVYWDPRGPCPIPFNVLTPEGDKMARVESVIEAYRRAFPDSWRPEPEMNRLARAIFLTAMENHLTLADVPHLFYHRGYLERLLARVRDAQTLAFFRAYQPWTNRYPEVVETFLDLIQLSLLPEETRLTLGQRENQLDLKRIMDEGQVLIINLGGLDLYGPTRPFLSHLVLTQLELAAQTRRHQQPSPFYFYLDEFAGDYSPNGEAFGQSLTRLQQGGVYLTLTEHDLDGTPATRTLLKHFQRKVVFKVGWDTAMLVARDRFLGETGKATPAPQTAVSVAPDPARQNPWRAYLRDLLCLPRQCAYVQTTGAEAVRIKIIPQRYADGAREAPEAIRTVLAKQSGYPQAQLERTIARQRAALPG